MARVTLDDNSKSSPHGINPEAMTIEQRLSSGFILLDKPPGPTSHQIASWVRDLLGLDRLGHGGTLDPFATGVLPLMAGKSMKLTKNQEQLVPKASFVLVSVLFREFLCFLVDFCQHLYGVRSHFCFFFLCLPLPRP